MFSTGLCIIVSPTDLSVKIVKGNIYKVHMDKSFPETFYQSIYKHGILMDG